MSKIQTEKNSTKRDVIIRHAAALFKAQSYSATTMRELAELVGVEAPSLYNHIGSKSELLQEICLRIGNEFVDKAAIILKGNGTALEKLEAAIRFHIHRMIEKFDEVYVANHEWKHLKEPHLSNFLSIRRQYEKSLIEIIEAGIQKKEIRPVNSYVAVLTILSAVRGLEFWQRNKKNISKQTLEDDMVLLLLKGIIH
jgi:AcrR family transcriptional regulator